MSYKFRIGETMRSRWACQTVLKSSRSRLKKRGMRGIGSVGDVPQAYWLRFCNIFSHIPPPPPGGALKTQKILKPLRTLSLGLANLKNIGFSGLPYRFSRFPRGDFRPAAPFGRYASLVLRRFPLLHRLCRGQHRLTRCGETTM